MLTTRSLATGLAVALTTAGLVSAGTSVGSAATSGTAPLVEGTGSALVQGVAVDQTGRFVDDVLVEARNLKGNIKASDFTYALPDNENSHGYFALHVGRGTYTLTLSKDGYETVEIEAGTVGRRGTISMGEVEIDKFRVATDTSAKLKDDSVTTGQNAKVIVNVDSEMTNKPTGKVVIKKGDKVVGSDKLVKDDNGEIKISVDSFKKGSYELKAFYLGSPYLKESSSRKLELTVTRK